ncbi:MAG: glutamine synthetase family protein [Actinomycetota bacterium]|nr:glutamine synthetase family protein [Actinomycetota bacterium]
MTGARPPFPLPLDELPAHADEVVLALPDLDGRLQATRLDTTFFLEEVVPGGYGACSYLLACDVEMDTGTGYAWSPEQEGFGDLRLRPDLTTLRCLPWDPRTALVLADAEWPGGGPVAAAPRTVLRAQLDRLAAMGMTAWCATELEFLAFDTTYQQAWESSYHGLPAGSRFNVDYALVGTEGLEPLGRRIRQQMATAGMRLESARAECHPGQYEIVFRYAEAMATCDQHVVYKTGAKQIAAQLGQALTFMAKYDEGEGNSCHVHLSLRDRDRGTPVLAGSPSMLRHFVAGQTTYLPELMLLFAPHVNSYKRLQPGAFAPSAASWGEDDRLCAVRTLGSGPARRIEHRVAGGDANPYLVVAAILAAGMQGIEERLDPGPARVDGGDTPALPRSLDEAVDAFAASGLAAKAFGIDVVDHLLAAARAELAAFRRSVTDWERRRGFERL